MDAALVAYDNVLAENPDHAAALLHRASILADMGHTDLALESYEHVIQNDQNTADNIMLACIQKGSILVQADRTTELERFCNELLSKYDGSPAVLSMVGAFHCNIGQPNEGLEYYRQALDHAKSNTAMAERLKAIIGTIDSKGGPAVSDPPGTPK
jgi:tetratricopeptide (TPR) repeat protein